MKIGPNISKSTKPIYGANAGRLAHTVATYKTRDGKIEQVVRRWRDAAKVAALAVDRGAIGGEVAVFVWTHGPALAEIARYEFEGDNNA